MFLTYLLPRDNINIPSDEQILFNDLCSRQLSNILSESRGVLSMEFNKAVPHLSSFLELLKMYCFLKVQVAFLSILCSIVTQMHTYAGNTTACTFYDISQHKM